MEKNRIFGIILIVLMFAVQLSIDALCNSVPNSAEKCAQIRNNPFDTALFILEIAGIALGLYLFFKKTKKKAT